MTFDATLAAGQRQSRAMTTALNDAQLAPLRISRSRQPVYRSGARPASRHPRAASKTEQLVVDVIAPAGPVLAGRDDWRHVPNRGRYMQHRTWSRRTVV
jgi:hypothetical protein